MTRGATNEPVYATRRAHCRADAPVVDAQTNAEWRAKGFYPVLNEREPTPEANREGSVLPACCASSGRIPLPTGAVLPGSASTSRSTAQQQCPAIEGWTSTSASTPTGACPTGCRPDAAASTTRWRAGSRPARRASPQPPLPAAHAKRSRSGRRSSTATASRHASSAATSTSTVRRPPLFRRPARAGRRRRIFRAGALADAARAADRADRHAPPLRRSRVEPLSTACAAHGRRSPRRTCPMRSTRRAWRAAARCSSSAGYEVSALPSYEPEVASNPFVAFATCRSSRAIASCSTRRSSP